MVNKVIPYDRLEVFKFRHFHRSGESKGWSPTIADVDQAFRDGRDYRAFQQQGKVIPGAKGFECLRG